MITSKRGREKQERTPEEELNDRFKDADQALDDLEEILRRTTNIRDDDEFEVDVTYFEVGE